MNIFFTSDTHYFHANIIRYSNRPFSSVQEMNEKMIENYNAVVKPNDIVYHLGDFSFGKLDETIKIASRLNGKKHLITGNHDHKHREQKSFIDNFVWVKDYHELRHDNTKIVLCHYPFESWNTSGHGSIHLHGHSHSNLGHNNKKRMDVGVDCHDYAPISLEEIIEVMKNRGNAPHH